MTVASTSSANHEITRYPNILSRKDNNRKRSVSDPVVIASLSKKHLGDHRQRIYSHAFQDKNIRRDSGSSAVGNSSTKIKEKISPLIGRKTKNLSSFNLSLNSISTQIDNCMTNRPTSAPERALKPRENRASIENQHFRSNSTSSQQIRHQVSTSNDKSAWIPAQNPTEKRPESPIKKALQPIVSPLRLSEHQRTSIGKLQDKTRKRNSSSEKNSSKNGTTASLQVNSLISPTTSISRNVEKTYSPLLLKNQISISESSSQSSLIDPRLVMQQLKPFNETRDDEINLAFFQELSGREAEDFDKSCKRLIKEKWKKIELPDVTSDIINERGIKVCKRDVDKQAHKEKSSTIEEWVAMNTPRTEDVVHRIQKSGILVQPIIKRLAIMKSILSNAVILKKTPSVEQSGKKTIFIEKLYTVICDLLTSGAMEKKNWLDNFLHIVGEIEQTTQVDPEKMVGQKRSNKTIKGAIEVNRKVLEILLLNFGNDSHEITKVLETLRKWSNTTQITKTLKEYVLKWSIANIKIRNITNFEHLWIEQVDYEKGEHLPGPIDKIRIGECVRSLILDGAIQKNRITINGKDFYNVLNPSQFTSDEEFFVEFFLQLYTSECGLTNLSARIYKNESQIDRSFRQHGHENTESPKLKRKSLLLQIEETLLQGQNKSLTVAERFIKILPILKEDRKVKLITIDSLLNEPEAIQIMLREVIVPLLIEEKKMSMEDKINHILMWFPGKDAYRYARIIKMMSMNCWIRADWYLRLLYPRLHKPPSLYFIKLLNGIESHITVNQDNLDDFGLKEIKNYGVYRRLKTDLEENFPKVEDRQLAFIPLCWSIKSSSSTEWYASLRIQPDWQINQAASQDEKEDIIDSLVQSESMLSLIKELPEGSVNFKKLFKRN